MTVSRVAEAWQPVLAAHLHVADALHYSCGTVDHGIKDRNE